MRGLALTASSKLLAFYVYLVGWAKYHAAEQMEDIPTLEIYIIEKNIAIILDIICQS